MAREKIDTPDIAKLLAEIEYAGWHVSSLNQMSDGKWMAAVRKPEFFSSGFAQAETAALALQRAWLGRQEPLPDRIPVRPISGIMPVKHPIKAPRERVRVRPTRDRDL